MSVENGPSFKEGQSLPEEKKAIEGRGYQNLTGLEKERLEDLGIRPYKGKMLSRGEAMEVILLERQAQGRIDELIAEGMDPREAREQVLIENNLEE